MFFSSPDAPPFQLKPGDELLLKSPRSQRSAVYKVESLRIIRDADVLKLEGIDSISDAYRLVGMEIHGSEELLEKDAPVNIMEFTVIDASGAVWGQVADFLQAGLNELLEVLDPATGQILYVPYVEEIVKKIDPETRTILIDPPDGLRTLNQP